MRAPSSSRGKYSFDKYGEGRNTIVTLIQSFHGRTVTTLKATGQEKFHQYFFPFTEGFAYAKANDLADVTAKADKTCCAVMMEMIQGEGGVLPLDKEFVQGVAKYCKENDILLIVDEVQTGIGRCGSLFAYEQYGIAPDIVTMAKGLGGGLPIGGVLAAKSCADVMGPGTHGSTFGGNPVSAASANVVLDTVMKPEFLKEVEGKGRLHQRKSPGISLPGSEECSRHGTHARHHRRSGKARRICCKAYGTGRSRPDGRNRRDPSAAASCYHL